MDKTMKIVFALGVWRTTKPFSVEHFDVDVAKAGLKALRDKTA